ncbi:MAG: purine-nucleoside phosphorylase [Proteobacteria bacterium]|nr:MAG: purine-nucleoside phosphorylase [Pseudomonadota bacterium]
MQEIQDVVAYLEPRLSVRPDVAIILGSGLGAMAELVENPKNISYDEIPHFHAPTVGGHHGRIVSGTIRGVNVAVLQGRWHCYEGHSMNSVVIPTRALAALGAHTIVLTNAAGGVNLGFQSGDLMIIADHLNLMGDNPLTGRDSVMFGPRFPDMSEPYCKECIVSLEDAADRLEIEVKKGIYVGVRGPTYETPAEVRMVRTLGGDAVGMSTVPEAIAARHLGMRVVGLSCITNMAAGIEQKSLDHAEVQEAAERLTAQISKLVAEALPEIARHPGRASAKA